jgi:DNA-directed RNA polymerase beta subunit
VSDYLDNTTANIRLIGIPAIFNPFAAQTSSARSDMFGSHLQQVPVLMTPDFPRIYTGAEIELGKYTFNTTNRTQDIQVIACIPKYVPISNGERIACNPSMAVIYLGLEDHKVYVMYVNNFTLGSDGYGYTNRLHNKHLLTPGMLIEKDTVLQSSPTQEGHMYKYGLNLNVAYMTLHQTIEDAMLVSESAAKRMETESFHTVRVPIQQTAVPLNLYGDDSQYKIFPDIGESVREDGIMLATRAIRTHTYIEDMRADNLKVARPMHDRCIYADDGTVVDITVHIPRKSKIDATLYGQILKYHNSSLIYYESIVDVYKQVTRDRLALSSEFRSLVAIAMGRLIAAGKQIHGVPNTRNACLAERGSRQLDTPYIEITYMNKRTAQLGFKITGRDGAKGVIAQILPDDEMPVDDYGIRADVVIDPTSPIKRMNGGQLYEADINRCSEFVRRRIMEIYEAQPHLAFTTLLEYYNDINPNYAKLVENTLVSEKQKMAHVSECIREGIYLHIPPFLNTMQDVSILTYLANKWNVPTSPVSYVVTDGHGNKTIERTNCNVSIGEKYILVLCKIPEPAASGISYVSHNGLPVKMPPHVRVASRLSKNSIRFGEDEGRVIAMDGLMEEWMRLIGLQAHSTVGVGMTVKQILESDDPLNIGRFNISTDAVQGTNVAINQYHTMCSVIGLETVDVDVPPIELFCPEVLSAALGESDEE